VGWVGEVVAVAVVVALVLGGAGCGGTCRRMGVCARVVEAGVYG
jgi:hypothetical protein